MGLLAAESTSRADNAAILQYFREHSDLAERSEFCKHCYKQIYTQLYVNEQMVGFVRHDMGLELWAGNYLTKTAQINLTWDAVSTKIAALIEQGQFLVPIKAKAPEPAAEQLTLTPEESKAVGLPLQEEQIKTIDLAAETERWHKPIIDASGKYITEQDITDALCSGSLVQGGKFRIQEYFSALNSPTEKEQAAFLKNEYGISGRSWSFADGQSGWLNFDGKGAAIQRGNGYGADNSYLRRLSWPEAAKRLRLLVYNGQYLEPAEKEEYAAWAKEQQSLRDAHNAELDHAKRAILNFCERTAQNSPDFSDLEHIDLAQSTTGDNKQTILAQANLMRNEIVYRVDGSYVGSSRYSSTTELADVGIAAHDIEQLIQDAERAYAEWRGDISPEPAEKRPVEIGDIVYLEDNRAFTVESIGIFDVHLRDEDFPLIGRAVNRAEFAKLLAENPKNAELTAPEESPTKEPVPEEVADQPIEGEVLDNRHSSFVDRVMLDVERLSANDEPYHREPVNYTAPYHDNLPTAPREKFAANIAAIQKLKEIEQRMADGGAPANESEQSILAKYTGWGGLADAFDPAKGAWTDEYQQLKELLTDAEYTAARSSTLTAFYTPSGVIHAMHRTLARFGVKGGNILEPSMGTGAFIAHWHGDALHDTKFYGVELDSLTGRISKQLYQSANIQVTGYEKAALPDNYFDCVIGNVPFGNYEVNDPQYNRLHFKIHDYFIAKSIDKLRTGGIMAVITSSRTMDKKDERVRQYIAERCNLIGAVRLPNTAFKASGTETTTDILFLQKRDSLSRQDEAWIHIADSAEGLVMNRYFFEHPEMICGRMEKVSGPYGPVFTCQPIGDGVVDRFGNTALEKQLDEAMAHLNAELPTPELLLAEEDGDNGTYIEADPTVRNFSFTVKDNKIYYREGAVMRECNPPEASAERIRRLIELRDTTRALIDAQMQDYPDEEIHRLQTQLNRQYDAYAEAAHTCSG